MAIPQSVVTNCVHPYFITHRSPAGDTDLRLGGVELRRRRLGGGVGDLLLALTGDGDLADRLTGDGDRAGFLTGVIDLALRLGAGEMDLPPLLGTGEIDPLPPRLTGDDDRPPRRTGVRDRRSTSYLGAESIMTESPE